MSTAPPTTRSRSASINGGSGGAPPLPPVPSPNATHSSFIPSRYVKHAVLINNCYPVKADEKGPKANEVSYLVFYATSKPAKLTKVGNFIERRVMRDNRKKRLSDVHCSLEILKKLMQSSKAHLNIFCKNIISVLDILLVDISELDIVRHCQNVFVYFCAAHDGSTLAVDAEFRTIYERVVFRFAEIATMQLDNSELSLRYQLIGLKALEGVVSSAALYAYNPKEQLGLVLPPILDCLIHAENGLDTLLAGRPDPSNELKAGSPDTNGAAPRRSMSVHTAPRDLPVTDEDVTNAAFQCLRALFMVHNGAHIRLCLKATFSYLDDHSCWWPSSFGVNIIKAILNSIQPQYRYMVVNELVERVDGAEKMTDITQRLQKKATLVAALESILTSALSLVGMPVLEVLNSLINILTKSLQSASKARESGQVIVFENMIQEGLVKSVGGLASHIYYNNQVPHIFANIVSKLAAQLGAVPQPSTIEGVPTVEYRKGLLQCLKAVVKTSRENRTDFNASDISSDLLTPCLGLLLDTDVAVRTAFAQVLITFLSAGDEGYSGSTNGDISGSPKLRAVPVSMPSTSGDVYFRNAMHQTLYTFARLPNAAPVDMAALYGVLRALLTYFRDDEFVRVFPMLFSLQDWCLQFEEPESTAGPHQIERKRAVATVIAMYFQKAVATYEMAEPQEYLNHIKTSRESESQWIPIYYENQESLTRTNTQWDTVAEPLDPVVSHPLARDHLITLLTTSASGERFRTGSERLNAPYDPHLVTPNGSRSINGNGHSLSNHSRDFGSGLYLSTLASPIHGFGHKAARSVDSRIRVSRHLEDWALPKIPSSTASELSTTDETEYSLENDQVNGGDVTVIVNSADNALSKKIGVDNLREALSVAQISVTAASDVGSIKGDSRLHLPSLYDSSTNSLKSKRSYNQLNGHVKNGSQYPTAKPAAAPRADLLELLNTIQVPAPTNPTVKSVSLVTPPY